MAKLGKIQITNSVYLVEVPEAHLSILCGCPADSVKHLMKRGLILTREENGVEFETGPNVVLLSDVMVQNGSFSNLAEFPVLQMLYKQGMILPNHPNNNGTKPMIIGSTEQVQAQMQYIYRGNYGLVSQQEIMATGISAEKAREMMRLKLKFAFGRISPAKDLLDTRMIEDEPVEIQNGVFIRRLKINVFEFMYQGETTVVDLNLARGSNYSSPYPLGFNSIKREYFAIIHSGEGDGWNVNHPCMSSILMFQGKIYLIDAGPNVIHSLMTLGIGVNEIEGIFHTHAHDDHFAGFTTLMRSDHKLKYYSTPLVRASVAKKLSALMFIDEKDLFNYFEVRDLEFDTWNDIEGLKVRPVFSPHPVETSIFFFRTLWKEGHCTYAHLADIASKKVLKGMITDNESENGISKKYYDQVMASYLEPADIKKIDVGGGLIHGDAEDFEKDTSKKIILSHFSKALTQHQKEIGSGAPFGMVDVLIPTSQNYLYRTALKFLKEYFPNAPLWQLNILLNHDLVTFNPESILIRRGKSNKDIFLILTGNVELIQSELGVRNILSSGALLGEIAGLDEVPSTGTFRAMNFVQALRLSRSLYVDFVKQNNLYESIRRLQSNREFLQNTWLFGEVVAYPIQNRLAQSMETIDCDEAHTFPRKLEFAIYIVKSGILERYIGDRVFETLEPGYFFGEECVLFENTSLFRVRAASPSKVYRIPGEVLLDIPVVRWKLFETFQKRMKLLLKPELTGRRPFDKQDEYNALMVEFEQQHQAISERAGKLVSASDENADISVLKDELNLLIRSIDFHIKQEEALMKRHNYSGYEIHHARHLSVLNEIQRIHMQTDYKEPDIDKSFLDMFQNIEFVKNPNKKQGKKQGKKQK